MHAQVIQGLARFGCALSMLLLWGCAATIAKPQLYLLDSSLAEVEAQGSDRCTPVAVRVQLPAYLQREGLVLQLDDNELVAADDHLWAEPMVYGVERLLRVCLNPAPSQGAQPQPSGFKQVEVVVERLHGDTNGISRLQASWTESVGGKVGGTLNRFAGTAAQPEAGYSALVSAQRSLLLDLCHEIAARVAHCTP